MTDEKTGHDASTLPACLPRHLGAKTRYTRPEAAEYLAAAHGITRSPATLAKLATIGGGPEFRKFNAGVVYDRASLDEWVAGKLSLPKASTAASP